MLSWSSNSVTDIAMATDTSDVSRLPFMAVKHYDVKTSSFVFERGAPMDFNELFGNPSVDHVIDGILRTKGCTQPDSVFVTSRQLNRRNHSADVDCDDRLSSCAEHPSESLSADPKPSDTSDQQTPLGKSPCDHRHRDMVELLVKYGGKCDTSELNVCRLPSSGEDDQVYRASAASTLLELAAAGDDVINNNDAPPQRLGNRENDNVALVSLLLSKGATSKVQLSSPKVNGHQSHSSSISTSSPDYLRPDTAFQNSTEMLQLLLESGEQHDEVESNHSTACHAILDSNQNLELVEDRARDSRSKSSHLLMENRANINREDSIGRTALYKACASSCLELASFLIQNGAEVNSSTDCVPLVAACKKNSLEIAQLLLKSGAMATVPVTCKHSCDGCVPLGIAAKNSNVSMLSLLLEYNADVNQTLCDGCTAAHIIAASKDPNAGKCLDLLLNREADVNILNASQETPLYVACNVGVVETVEKLLNRCPPPSKTTRHSPAKQPLEVACRNNRVDVLKVLLGRRFDCDIRCDDTMDTSTTPLCIAAERGYLEIAACLLDAGASVNRTERHGQTALHCVIENMADYPEHRMMRNSHHALFDLLLARGADVNIRSLDDRRRTPMTVATMRGLGNAVRVMLQFGGDPNFVTNQNSLLTLACSKCGIRTAVFLLAAGADPNLGNSDPFRRAWQFRYVSSYLCQALVFAGYRIQPDKLTTLDSKLLLPSWLVKEATCPPSLRRQCRIVIRRQLSVASGQRTIIPLVNRLPLPVQLQLYLKFEGQLAELDLAAVCENNGIDDYENDEDYD